MEPRPIRRDHITMLVDGLTVPITRDGEQFPALPHVREEVDGLQKLFGGISLVDQDFRVPKVESALEQQPFSVVHIASHGEFSGDVRKTFVLTYDDRLTLNGLEHLIRPSQLRDQPVELLSLSACQTAAGDDRAALGLAGVAIKAGARSAFATLWCVDDKASTDLVQDFYEHLQKSADISKAKALQAAQVKLLRQPLTSHPCLWAPYLIIGNWL
jgi:CHAT domain-containing protein